MISFESTTATVVFAVTGIAHFLISIASMILMCECTVTLLLGMVYGGTFVPFALAFCSVYTNNSKLAVVASAFLLTVASFGGALTLRLVYDVCNERLLFMSLVHGAVIPGVVVSGIGLIRG